MPAPFTFLDRIDQLVDGPAAVTTTVRQLVLPGGDRPVTKAGDASRIPVEQVRQHVVDVALGVVQERVRDGLVEALEEHFAAVRAEFEMLEGDCPQNEDAGRQWSVELRDAYANSLRDGDIPQILDTWQDHLSGMAYAERLTDAVLAFPVDDPDAVLARVGVTSVALDAIVAEIRKPVEREVTPEEDQMLRQALLRSSEPVVYQVSQSLGWSLEALGLYLSRFDAVDDIIREGVQYVLTDADTVATGAELLGLSGDAAFTAWAEERLMFSTPEEDAAAVAEVLARAAEGGDEPDDSKSTTETAAGASEGAAPAARICRYCGNADYPLCMNSREMEDSAESGTRRCFDALVKQGGGERSDAWLKGVESKHWPEGKPRGPRADRTEGAEPSDLTRAVGAAFAALFDHGCESDKAMAAALGVERSVVAGSRKGTTPWAPDDALVRQVYDMISAHENALARARDGLEAFT